jgi:hypothetical protein
LDPEGLATIGYKFGGYIGVGVIHGISINREKHTCSKDNSFYHTITAEGFVKMGVGIAGAAEIKAGSLSLGGEFSLIKGPEVKFELKGEATEANVCCNITETKFKVTADFNIKAGVSTGGRVDVVIAWAAFYVSVGGEASGNYVFEGDTKHGTLTVTGSASLKSYGGYVEYWVWGGGYQREPVGSEEIATYTISETYNLY